MSTNYEITLVFYNSSQYKSCILSKNSIHEQHLIFYTCKKNFVTFKRKSLLDCMRVFAHGKMATAKLQAIGMRGRESRHLQPQNPSCGTLQTHQSATRPRSPSYTLEGLEYSSSGIVVAAAVTGVSSPASSRLAVSRNARGRRQKVVAAQACSRDL